MQSISNAAIHAPLFNRLRWPSSFVELEYGEWLRHWTVAPTISAARPTRRSSNMTTPLVDMAGFCAFSEEPFGPTNGGPYGGFGSSRRVLTG
jgi:hypothetical protein